MAKSQIKKQRNDTKGTALKTQVKPKRVKKKIIPASGPLLHAYRERMLNS